MKTSTKAPHAMAAAALSLLAPLGCAADPAQPGAGEPQAAHGAVAEHAAPLPAGLATVPGMRQPKPGLYSAGQPEAAQWSGIAGAGVRTVVNLRPDAEQYGRDERAEVEAAGMRYVQIPVAGAADITPANAERLGQVLQQAEGPVLVHCASGNRVGALLALEAARGGKADELAIAFGKSAGLAGAEPAVRERLAERAARD